MQKTLVVVLVASMSALWTSASADEAPRTAAAYSGVTPEGGEPPAPKPPPEGLQFVTWPGFRVTDAGGAEVFLQMTGEVPYKLTQKGTRVAITIDRSKVHLKNSLRRMITDKFAGSPVTHFQLRELKNNQLRLDIQLKRKLTPQVAHKQSGAYHYLIVTFPALRKSIGNAPG